MDKYLQSFFNFKDEADKLNKLIAEEGKQRKQAEYEFEKYQIESLNRITEFQISQIKIVETKKKESEERVFKTAITRGIQLEAAEKLKRLTEYEKAARKQIKKAKGDWDNYNLWIYKVVGVGRKQA